jgi:hypothetical protein
VIQRRPESLEIKSVTKFAFVEKKLLINVERVDIQRDIGRGGISRWSCSVSPTEGTQIYDSALTSNIAVRIIMIEQSEIYALFYSEI